MTPSRDRLLIQALADVIGPTLAKLFTADEIDSVSVHWSSRRHLGLRVPETGGPFLWLTLVARGEEYRGVVLDLSTADSAELPGLAEGLASELEDWIAQSGFGWGQRRT